MSEVEPVQERPNSSGEEEEEAAHQTEEVEQITEPLLEIQKQRTIKKAQRTHRVDVTSTQNSGPARPNAKPAKPQKASTPAMSNDQFEDIFDEEEDEEEGGEDYTAKVIEGLLKVTERLIRVLLACVSLLGRLLVAVVGMVRRGLGVLFGAALFAALTYAIGTYVMTPVTESDIPNFEARLKFLLRYQVWPTLPVFLAAVAGTLRRDSEVHKTFGRDSFEHALLSLFNLLLLSTHLQTDCLLWVGACLITATVFSLLHWICLVYTKRRGSVFALPGTLLNFGVMAYNLYIIFGQDLGYVPVVKEPEVTSSPSQGTLNYWNHVTMCHLVEQMFCKP